MTRHPQRLPELLAALDGQGVAYPDELRTYVDRAARLAAVTMREAGAPTSMSAPPNLLEASVEELFERASEHQLRTVLRQEYARGVSLVLEELATQAMDLLVLEADAVLDQVRPRFTAAATAVRKAVEAGIQPRMRAADVIANDKQRRHWLGLPEQAAILEEISALRILLSQVLHLPPFRERLFPGDRPRAPWGAAFTQSALVWDEPNEVALDRWLRLSSGTEPVELLSIADTATPPTRGDLHLYVGDPDDVATAASRIKPGGSYAPSS